MSYNLLSCLYFQDEDPNNSWLHFQENDIVSILSQFSVDKMFSRALFIRRENGTCVCAINYYIIMTKPLELWHL